MAQELNQNSQILEDSKNKTEVRISDIIEDLEFIEKEDLAPRHISPDSLIHIAQLRLIIDGAIYDDPNVNTLSNKGETKPTLALRDVLFRNGDVMNLSELQRKIRLSKLALAKSDFFHKNNEIDFRVLKEDSDIIHFKIYITLTRGFRFFVSVGNLFAGFGYNYPNGLVTSYFAGLNRMEANFVYKSINLASDETKISQLFLDLGLNNFVYWIDPRWDRYYTQKNIMFGINPYIAFSNTPLVNYSLGLSLVGLEHIYENIERSRNFPKSSLPSKGDSGVYTADMRAAIELYRAFNSTGFFDTYLDSSTRYIFGSSLGAINKNATGLYDLLSSKLDLQIAGKWLIHEALRLRLAYMGSYINDDNPYAAQVNTLFNFYDIYSTNVEWIDRNIVSPDDSPFQQHAFAAKLEGKLGINTNKLGYEFLLSYEISSVLSSEERNMSSDYWNIISNNARYLLFPAFLLHLKSPINLIIRFDFPMLASWLSGMEQSRGIFMVRFVSTKGGRFYRP